jgi:filamentous hemagglutinin family protein
MRARLIVSHRASMKIKFLAMTILTVLFLGWNAQPTVIAQAQAPSPITSSGLNTQISAPINNAGGQVQHNITGGARPGSGPNLFHSFGEFGIPANNIANFLNETALPTSNILGRVTGGNPSNIFGTIQTTGFGAANLFLMNPAGIVFGPNASLNVGGSVSFTTADYLRFTDGAKFNAIPGPQDAAISSAPVAAFGFLGSNPGAITVQGSQFTVLEGQGISIIGGNIAITGDIAEVRPEAARISAPGGQINLTSVASPGEVLAPSFEPASTMPLGSIAISQGSVLDVSADTSGSIKIRSGQFVMDHATMSADTVNGNSPPIAIDIKITESLSISSEDVAALTARTTGAGNAGEIRVSSDSMDVTATAVNSFYSVIDTHTSGSGDAGNVGITTRDLNVSGGLVNFIDSGTSGANPGRGGDVAITAHNIQTHEATIATGNFTAFFFDQGGAGKAGNVTITADSLQMTSSQIITGSQDFISPAGTAGDIIVNARNIALEGTSFSSSGQEHGGAITLTADQLFANSSSTATQTADGAGGSINVAGGSIELANGSSFVSTTTGDGHAGSISIVASDHLGLLRSTSFDRPSGIFSSSFGDVGTAGSAGDIFITTPRLEMTGGARINTSTATSGRGGNVIIHTGDSLSISGETDGQPLEPLFNLGSLQPSGIFTRTVGGNCSGLCGNAGNVSISTGSLIMGTGAQVNSGTSSTGQGGNINVNARDTISINGTLSDGQPAGMLSRTIGTAPDSGTGGNIALAAGQSVSMGNGATISASSTGSANAGNIAINAGAQFVSQNASVTTEANQASGGNITIQATDAIRLVNSQLSTSVQGGPNTAGGNILLDPALVTIQNSQVTAQAVQGQGGNINIIAGTFLADPTSVISASSQFGLSGSVNIQSPVSSLSNTLATLTQRPLQAQNLLRQRCAAQVNGQLSSLVVSGRDALPVEPGNWLMSPLAWLAEDDPTPQAHVASKLVFEPISQRQGRSGQSSDQRESLSQRGVWDRETGCGS